MRHILIVDNERENRENLKLALEDENPDWNIYTAGSDAEGIEIVQRQVNSGEPIEVVLTDLVMDTEESGIRMIQEARRIDPLIMAILFTAKEKSLDRYAAFDSGAFDVIQKNILGTSGNREINVRTRVALRYREWSPEQMMNSFLRRYFDSKLFERIIQDSSVLSVRERVLTVCFWDIRGFSLLCEILRAKPELIAGFLTDYFQIAANTIFEHGGVLDKFIGDGVMALFGVLQDTDGGEREEAIAAIEAAKVLRSRFQEMLPTWLQRWSLSTQQKIQIGLGCGIATGEVLVGNFGTSFRDQFTALGPTVNFAARIEARSISGQILVSKRTHAMVNSLIALYPAGEIDDIKNIPGVFELFSLEPH